MDNLQSVTYQTFEQDPVKYYHYEEVNTPYHRDDSGFIENGTLRRQCIELWSSGLVKSVCMFYLFQVRLYCWMISQVSFVLQARDEDL